MVGKQSLSMCADEYVLQGLCNGINCNIHIIGDTKVCEVQVWGLNIRDVFFTSTQRPETSAAILTLMLPRAVLQIAVKGFFPKLPDKFIMTVSLWFDLL